METKEKMPKHALTFEDVKRVVLFISNYAEEYGIPQPSAPRGRDDSAPTFLHSSVTKINIHKLYRESCEEAAVRNAGKNTILAIGKRLL